jgi:hypothetical protein
MLAKVFTCAVIGLDAQIVEVEVDTGRGHNVIIQWTKNHRICVNDTFCVAGTIRLELD